MVTVQAVSFRHIQATFPALRWAEFVVAFCQGFAWNFDEFLLHVTLPETITAKAHENRPKPPIGSRIVLQPTIHFQGAKCLLRFRGPSGNGRLVTWIGKAKFCLAGSWYRKSTPGNSKKYLEPYAVPWFWTLWIQSKPLWKQYSLKFLNFSRLGQTLPQSAAETQAGAIFQEHPRAVVRTLIWVV